MGNIFPLAETIMNEQLIWSIQANTNGHLHLPNEPTVSVLNRGFLYGDAVYEVWRSYGGTLYAWEEHWKRLECSARVLGFAIPWTKGQMWGEIVRTVEGFRRSSKDDGDVYIRLQVYRGEGAIGLDTALAADPGYVILVKAVPVLSDEDLASGLRLHVAKSLFRNAPDTLNPAWKTGNYLNNLMGLQEAKSRGADDVVMLNQAGFITEASTSNIAFIRGNEFVTPRLDAGILAGVTRSVTLSTVANMAGLEPIEENLRIEDLAQMDECMLLSSTKDVQPVVRIDDFRFSVGDGTASRR